MKQRGGPTVVRWMTTSVLATVALTVGPNARALAAAPTTPVPTYIDCDGSITTAYDAAGTPRQICVTPRTTVATVVASSAIATGGASPTTGGSGGSGSGSNHDTTYGILIGAVLVAAGAVTSLYARRRKHLLGKPFRRRSA